jgi:hypothetical protein
MSNKWIPEIMYEEGEEGSSNIPFIMVPSDETMPHLIYMFESRQTGEEEPGLDGNPVPIVEWDLHQYADMAVLKDKLELSVYDQVREALGLEPMKTAVEKGKSITNKIRDNIEK